MEITKVLNFMCKAALDKTMHSHKFKVMLLGLLAHEIMGYFEEGRFPFYLGSRA